MKHKDRRDWSEKDLKKHIVDQRKYLWRESTIERVASWLDLRSGITAVDVGCGLGYLGWTFWRHYGSGSSYIGVDCSIKLLREAQEIQSEWSGGGSAYFANGSAYSLPLPDECADWTMCQTLLMHLEFPENASVHLFHPAVPLPEIIHQRFSKTNTTHSVPDLRTTLCWEPLRETDQNGHATVTFFTSDIPGKYVIKVMAFSKEGILEETTQTIVVK